MMAGLAGHVWSFDELFAAVLKPAAITAAARYNPVVKGRFQFSLARLFGCVTLLSVGIASFCTCVKHAYNPGFQEWAIFALLPLSFTSIGASIGCISGDTRRGAYWGAGLYLALQMIGVLFMPQVRS